MKYLPYAMELGRLTGIILIAAVLLMFVMVTAPAAETLDATTIDKPAVIEDPPTEPDHLIGVVTGAGAKLAAEYAPLAPAGHWYDGILNWWGGYNAEFPPHMWWWLH